MKKLISGILTGAMVFSAMASMTVLADEGDITIRTVAELQQLAIDVNNGKSYSGKTVTLENDINVGNIELTPIGTTTNPFKGTFDGNNCTISNYKITRSDSNVGFFGVVRDGVLKNVTIKDATISGDEAVAGLVGNAIVNNIINCDAEHVTVNAKHWAGAIAGYAYSSYDGCDIKDSNITIAGPFSLLKNGDKAGALVGYMGEGTYKVEKCTAYNVKVTAGRDVGGLVGAAGGGTGYTVSFNNCTVSGGSTIEATQNPISFFGILPNAGGIIGRSEATPTFTECNVADTTINSKGGSGYIGTLCGSPRLDS